METRELMGFTGVVRLVGVLCAGAPCARAASFSASFDKDFSPDMFRAQYRTAPYGLPRYFIPQFQRAIASHGKGKEYYQANWAKPEHLAKHRDVLRHYLGYFLVHDALSTEAFGIHLDDWYAIQDRFVFDGTEQFVLYADPASPFGCANARVMVSSYAKGDRLLVIAFNDTDTPIESIRFDRTKLKALAPGAKLDLADEETLKPVIASDADESAELDSAALWRKRIVCYH